MDGQRFDNVLRQWTSARRSLFGLGLGSLAGLTGVKVSEAKRKKKRKKKGKNKNKPQKCVPQSTTQTCAGKCGSVKNNCGASVSCSCPPGECCNGKGACGACLTFRTSQGYTSNFGGLPAADQLCQGLADAANLPGTYLAWLSDSTGSPSTRFTRATVPYRLVNGDVVANNWTDLTDGAIARRIDVTETGSVNDKQVWTNTRTNGTPGSSRLNTTAAPDGEHCFNWTHDHYLYETYLGFPLSSDESWTDFETRPCAENFGNVPPPWGLYCFQQR